MNLAGEMQSLMVSLDVKRAREVWKTIAPHVRQPESDEEMLATLHLARTQSELLNKSLRLYSHQWLSERNLPSMLPLEMRRERIEPQTVQGVGISINSRSELFQPIVGLVREAMQDAVLEIYADGRESNTDLIKRRMAEARHNTVRMLLGVK